MWFRQCCSNGWAYQCSEAGCAFPVGTAESKDNLSLPGQSPKRHWKDELQLRATSNISKFPFHFSSAHSLSTPFLFFVHLFQLFGTLSLSTACFPWHLQTLQKHIDIWGLNNIYVISFKIAEMLHSVIAVFSRYVFTNTVMVLQLEWLGLNRCFQNTTEQPVFNKARRAPSWQSYGY